MPSVLIVDDSVVMRRVLASAVEGISGYTIAGLAGSAEEALSQLATVRPHALVLDVNLPGMNGLDLLDRLRPRTSTPVVLVSSRDLPEGVAGQALVAGRVTFLRKPDGVATTLDGFRRDLQQRLQSLLRAHKAGRGERPTGERPTPARLTTARFRLIAIGASTGGVDAVTTLLCSLQPPLPPIVVTIHMPAGYTSRFAKRLSGLLGLDVREAEDGEMLQPNTVRIAPGGRHLRIEHRQSGPATRLADGPQVSGHKPSVDVLFASVASSIKAAAIGVILTGMGRDGAQSLLAMRASGAATLGQAEASCVVYGMPKVAMQLGAVERELPLTVLGGEILRLLGRKM